MAQKFEDLKNRQALVAKIKTFWAGAARLFVLLALLIMIGSAILFVIATAYRSITGAISFQANVEPYCAARYNYSVSEYKECKALSPAKLLIKLTEEQSKETDVIDLPALK